jgi:large subunit ribosomal protein L35
MQKTKKSVVKRFKVTATGKVKRRTGGYRRALQAKSNEQKRRAARDKDVSPGFSEQVKQWITVGL